MPLPELQFTECSRVLRLPFPGQPEAAGDRYHFCFSRFRGPVSWHAPPGRGGDSNRASAPISRRILALSSLLPLFRGRSPMVQMVTISTEMGTVSLPVYFLRLA